MNGLEWIIAAHLNINCLWTIAEFKQILYAACNQLAIWMSDAGRLGEHWTIIDLQIQLAPWFVNLSDQWPTPTMCTEIKK